VVGRDTVAPMATQPSVPVPFILYGALFASTFLYLVILQVAVPPGGALDPTIAIVLTAAGIMQAGASLVLPRMLRDKALAALRLSLKEVEVASDSLILRDAKTSRVVFANPDQARARARAVAQSYWILGWALAEGVAVYGLVIGFMGGTFMQVIPLFVISWVLFIAQPPSEKALFEALEKSHEAKLEG
jgi:hypothetical protein